MILTSHGKQRAAVISIDDLRLLEVLEDMMDLEEAHRRLAEKGEDISAEDLYRDLGL